MSDRPKDVNGEEVELGVPYWARHIEFPEGQVEIGTLVDRYTDSLFTSFRGLAFLAGDSVYSGPRHWSEWQFIRAVPPSFDKPSPPLASQRLKDVNGDELKDFGYYWVFCEDHDPGIVRVIPDTDGRELHGTNMYLEESDSALAYFSFRPVSLAPLLPPPDGTVRVRIPVGVTAEGDWAAYGYRDCVDAYDNVLSDNLNEPYRTSFVEADVPKPPPPTTVEGTVSQ